MVLSGAVEFSAIFYDFPFVDCLERGRVEMMRAGPFGDVRSPLPTRRPPRSRFREAGRRCRLRRRRISVNMSVPNEVLIL